MAHESGHKVTDLLPILKEQARQYEAWTEAANRAGGSLTTVEMSVYRVQASNVELLKPLLIWLHEPDRPLPAAVTNAVINAAESWVVRRQLLRLAGSDLGRIVADLIKTHQNATVSNDQNLWMAPRPGDVKGRTFLRMI